MSPNFTTKMRVKQQKTAAPEGTAVEEIRRNLTPVRQSGVFEAR
jgi:hypothetical protein